MPGVKLTYEDLVRLPDDGLRHELIDGEHYVTPAPDYRHQSIVTNLATEFVNFLREHPLGDVMVAPFDVRLAGEHGETVVEPDLLYFSQARALASLRPTYLGDAPELVVEIESPSTRQQDRTLKHALYARTGVREYWLIDPDAQTVSVFRREPTDETLPRIPRVLQSPALLTTPLLPGLSLSLDVVFARRMPV